MELEPAYVTGFADAHASFTFSRSGRQLALYFAIRIDARDRPLLQQIQRFFGGAGSIYDAHRSAYYRVTHREDLVAIVEHFDAFPLKTRKREAYEIWRTMVRHKRAFRAPDRELLAELAEQLSTASR